MASTYSRGQEEKTESLSASFLEDLSPIQGLLNTLLEKYGVKEGISLEAKEGKMAARIDVDALYSGLRRK